mmetsp:Transcript_130576/g.418662  ORF Transcript_130576/g.418662 Transcript_130576/m.418662 type:complete len:328 (-) Transcript_130576:193-1176(-)
MRAYVFVAATAISRRIVHLRELLASGRSMTAHVSSNGVTHSEKIQVLVMPPSVVAHSAESYFMQAVLHDLLQTSQSWPITDRGHMHSDGSVQVAFFLKHADPRRSRIQFIGAPPDSAQDVLADPCQFPMPVSAAPAVSENQGEQNKDAAHMQGCLADQDPFVGTVPGLESTRAASSFDSSAAFLATCRRARPQRRGGFGSMLTWTRRWPSAAYLLYLTVSAMQRVAEMKLKCCEEAVPAIRKCIEGNVDSLQGGLANHGFLPSAGFRAKLREGMVEPMIKFMVDGIVGNARQDLCAEVPLDLFYRDDMVDAVDAQTESLNRLVIDLL